MNIRNKILASVSAVALGTAIPAPAIAQFTVNNGTPFSETAQTVVADNLTVVATALNFGTFAALNKLADASTAVLTPAGTFTPTNGATSRIVDGVLGDHVPATITVSAGINSANIFVTYDNVFDLKGTITPTNVIQITSIKDNLATVGECVVSTNNDGASANVCKAIGSGSTIGKGTLSVTGGLVFNVGGTIKTKLQALLYSSEPYAGSFDVTLSY